MGEKYGMKINEKTKVMRFARKEGNGMMITIRNRTLEDAEKLKHLGSVITAVVEEIATKKYQ